MDVEGVQAQLFASATTNPARAAQDAMHEHNELSGAVGQLQERVQRIEEDCGVSSSSYEGLADARSEAARRELGLPVGLRGVPGPLVLSRTDSMVVAERTGHSRQEARAALDAVAGSVNRVDDAIERLLDQDVHRIQQSCRCVCQ